MSELSRIANNQAVAPQTPKPLGFFEERSMGQSLTRLDKAADLKSREIELHARLGQLKVQAVASVGSDAMTAQALLTGREKLLVEAEPGAIHGISHISQKLTLALGAVVDQTMREVTR